MWDNLFLLKSAVGGLCSKDTDAFYPDSYPGFEHWGSQDKRRQ